MPLKKIKKSLGPITENQRRTNPKLGPMHSSYLALLAPIEGFPINANI